MQINTEMLYNVIVDKCDIVINTLELFKNDCLLDNSDMCIKIDTEIANICKVRNQAINCRENSKLSQQ